MTQPTNDTLELVARTGWDGPELRFDFPGLRVGVAEYDEGDRTVCFVVVDDAAGMEYKWIRGEPVFSPDGSSVYIMALAADDRFDAGEEIKRDLTDEGTGRLVLMGTNNASGGLVIVGGTVQMSDTASVASVASIALQSGAVLDVSSFPGGWTLVSSQSLAGSGVVTGAVVAAAGGRFELRVAVARLEAARLVLGLEHHVRFQRFADLRLEF